MPGVGGNVHLGARRHVRFVRETTFGQVPGSPSWTGIPFVDDGMKLKATSPRYIPNTNYGGDFRRRVLVRNRLEVVGDFLTHPWPEVTQFLLDMALERQANHDIYSYAVDHYTPADPRRYLGAVAERLTIAVAGTGDTDVRLIAGLRAKLEEENNSLTENDFDYSGISPVPFMFAHAELRINNVLEVDIEAFTLTVENNVAAGPFVRTAGIDVGTAAYLIGQQRQISLELTKLNRDDDFNEAVRDGGSFGFDARFYHPDGHLMQIQLPALYPQESDEDGTPDSIARENPRFEAGVSGGADIIWGVDLAAGGTTVLPPLTTTSGD